MLNVLRRGLDGPYPRLPRPLDTINERWTRLRPRGRLVVCVVAALAIHTAVQARVHRAEQRWGGTPVTALVATADLSVGTVDPPVRQVDLPPAAVPRSALPAVPPGAVLALALPEGSVLTSAHLDQRGGAAGLADGLRAVPVPVEDGWAVEAGGWVDVWVLGAGEHPARQVAASRAVLSVRDDGAGRTALLGLAEDEVGPTTEGLALGSVLLTHAPPP